jgi:hypothetical protein
VVKVLTNIEQIGVGTKWPPEGELERLQRYDANRKLFEGRHELVFKDWVRLLRDDKKATLEIILNWHKRLSTLWADLLLGERPRITAGEPNSKEQQQLEAIIENNDFFNVAYEVVLDISRYGTGIFKLRYDGRAIIEAIPPALWFPVVSPDNIKDVRAHVIAWTFEVPTPTLLNKDKKTTYLRLEIHEKGKITNKLFELKDGVIKQELDVTSFYDDLQPEQATGIDDFLVVPVHNILTSDRVYGQDDYSDLDSIIQELEIRVAQISRILDKHADPNMAGPAWALEQNEYGEYVVKGGGKYFPVEQGDPEPKYITWDGQLEAAYREIDLLMEQLYTLGETSAAAFGQLKSGLAESGTALRRLMMTPLAKVNRIRMRFDPAIKKVLQLASQLEAKFGRGIELSTINIAWNDGLPQDEKEQAEIYSSLVQNGLISRETALKRLFEFDAETLRQELAKIAVEVAQETPALFTVNLNNQQQPQQSE